jgi:hypothetical protein
MMDSSAGAAAHVPAELAALEVDVELGRADNRCDNPRALVDGQARPSVHALA